MILYKKYTLFFYNFTEYMCLPYLKLVIFQDCSEIWNLANGVCTTNTTNTSQTLINIQDNFVQQMSFYMTHLRILLGEIKHGLLIEVSVK